MRKIGAAMAFALVLGGCVTTGATGGEQTRVVIGGRPAGCPHKYCGCGLRKYLGIDDRRLNRAWAWAELFPRTHARPGAAAVRRHHVMLLIRKVARHRWLVRDYNAGRHLSYIHVRNVRGYVFVDPNASTLSARRHQ